jgi:hypothetical protein
MLVSCKESQASKEQKDNLFQKISSNSLYKLVIPRDDSVIKQGVLGEAMHSCLHNGIRPFDVTSKHDQKTYYLEFADGYVFELEVHDDVVFQFMIWQKEELSMKGLTGTYAVNCPLKLLDNNDNSGQP